MNPYISQHDKFLKFICAVDKKPEVVDPRIPYRDSWHNIQPVPLIMMPMRIVEGMRTIPHFIHGSQVLEEEGLYRNISYRNNAYSFNMEPWLCASSTHGEWQLRSADGYMGSLRYAPLNAMFEWALRSDYVYMQHMCENYNARTRLKEGGLWRHGGY